MVDLAYVRAKAAELGDGSHSTTTMEFVGKLVKYGILSSFQVSTPAPKYPDALVERMVEAGKELAGAAIVLSAANDFRDELSSERSRVYEAIRGWMKAVAELPAEVDADLIEAARIEAEVVGGRVYDDPIDMQRAIALAAIKRGRALADADAGRVG